MSDNLCTRDVTLFIDRLAERAVTDELIAALEREETVNARRHWTRPPAKGWAA
jgi:hypothetical protein